MSTHAMIDIDGQHLHSWEGDAHAARTPEAAVLREAACARLDAHHATGGHACALISPGVVSPLQTFDPAAQLILLVPPLVAHLTPPPPGRHTGPVQELLDLERAAIFHAAVDSVTARAIAELEERLNPQHPSRLGTTHPPLRQHLNARDWHQLLTLGYLEVVSPRDSSRSYRIYTAGGSIVVYEHGKPTELLRVGVARPLSYAATILIHVVMIWGYENHYRTVAKHFAYA